ncbi:MAG TPA: hypothetical protein VF809_00910 [Candidatus Saccharimonadales bacterium]
MFGSEFPPFEDPEHDRNREFSEGGREGQHDSADGPNFSFATGGISDTPEDATSPLVSNIDDTVDTCMTVPDCVDEEEAVESVVPATFEEIIRPFQREHAAASGSPLVEFDYDLHFGLIARSVPSEAEAAEAAGEFTATWSAALDQWKDFDHDGRVILEAHTTDGCVIIVLEQDGVQIAIPPSVHDESMIPVTRYRHDSSSGRLHSEMYSRARLTDETSRRRTDTYFTSNQPVGSPEVRSLKELLERARPAAEILRDVYHSVADGLKRDPTVEQITRSAESATVFSKNVASVLAGKGHNSVDRPWEHETTDEQGTHMQVQIYQIYPDIGGEEDPRVIVSLDRPIHATDQEQPPWLSWTFHGTIVFRVDRGLFVGELSSYALDPEGVPHSTEPKRQAILGVVECATLHYFMHEPHLSARELYGR